MRFFWSINAFCALALANVAYASDPFSKATSFFDKLIDALTGTLAKSVLTLVVILFGYLTWSNRIDKKWGVSIIVGSIFIGSAAEIAAFFID